MATMVPPVVPPEYRSEGEREVFRRLRDDPGTDGWIVLHSLGLARHEQRVSGEVDFVVIVPGWGVLCLEVKGASSTHLRRDAGGLWFYGPNDKGTPRGPFKQAEEAMHSLKRELVNSRPDLAGIQFSRGVVFPFAPFSQRSPEWHDWEVIDARRLRSAPISRLVIELLRQGREYLASVPEAPWIQDNSPTEGQVIAIRDVLRGAFEVPVDRRARGEALKAELRRYTEEQFLALDAMAENPRTIFAAPAGAGKTLLALEAARRARADRRRVLLVCYNRLLGLWLEEEAAPLRPEVTAGTLHKRMLALSSQGAAPDGTDQRFWDERLPEQATYRLLEELGAGDEAHVYDELIVDEAQDLLHGPFLDFLDMSLRGGWAAGRWRLFGDFDNQTIFRQSSVSLAEFRVRRAADAALYTLRVNCRSTPRATEWVHLLAGLNPPYSRVLRPDDRVRPEFRYYRDAQHQRELLVEALEYLETLGFKGQDIVVLSARRARPVAETIDVSPWRERLRPYEQARGAGGGSYIGWTSVATFKGLDAPAVVVTDVETIGSREARDLFYIAITRVLQRLVILAQDHVREQAIRLLTGDGQE